MRKKVVQTILCATVLLLSVALSEALRSLLPNTFLAGCACAAPTSMALLLCLNMIHGHDRDEIQEHTLDLVRKLLDTTHRVAEDNEKITKKVNEMIEGYRVLYDMITEEEGSCSTQKRTAVPRKDGGRPDTT